ncbi:MAG: CDP-alcohol phosphatidyltransferase family protein [Halobacteriota archaeon]
MFKILSEIRISDFFTFLNLFFGFMGILYLFQDVTMSVKFLFISAIMDGADGFIASRIGEGSLGKPLDSLADAVSFGVLPALMIALSGHMAVAVAFLLTGVLRLARFNVLKKEDFVGYPITASAIVIASMFYLNFDILTVEAMAVVLAIFMILDIEYLKIRDNVILFVFAVVIISSFVVRDAAYAVLAMTLLYLASPFPGKVYQWMERRKKPYLRRV